MQGDSKALLKTSSLARFWLIFSLFLAMQLYAVTAEAKKGAVNDYLATLLEVYVITINAAD